SRFMGWSRLALVGLLHLFHLLERLRLLDRLLFDRRDRLQGRRRREVVESHRLRRRRNILWRRLFLRGQRRQLDHLQLLDRRVVGAEADGQKGCEQGQISDDRADAREVIWRRRRKAEQRLRAVLGRLVGGFGLMEGRLKPRRGG